MFFQETAQGIFVKCKVIPNAGKNQIAGWENDEIRIRIAAPPEKGAANKELVEYLANYLSIAKSCIEVVQGQTSRHKRLLLVDISLDELKKHFPNDNNL